MTELLLLRTICNNFIENYHYMEKSLQRLFLTSITSSHLIRDTDLTRGWYLK